MPNKSGSGERKPIEKLTEGIYEIVGIIPNKKSIYQPSYILFGKNGITYSASGHVAKQLSEYQDRLSKMEFKLEVEKIFNKKFKKDMLNLVELTKIKDKEMPKTQVKLTGFD